MEKTPSTDPAWLDREYNNRALVPEHAAHFERWATTSAQARQTSRPLLDVSYGHGPGETLDIKIDGQINPSLFAGTQGRIELRDGERVLAAVPVEMTVLP